MSVFCAGLPILAAVLQALRRRRLLTLHQSVAVVGAACGLALLPLSEVWSFFDPDALTATAINNHFLLGTAACLGAVWFNSFVYILVEELVSDDKVDPFVVLFWQALLGLIVVVLVVLGIRVVIPHADDLAKILRSSLVVERTGLSLLLGAGVVQSVCWVMLLQSAGSVFVSLLQALRTALMMSLSAMIWCSSQSRWHCLSHAKIVSAVIVVGSTFIFKHHHQQHHQHHHHATTLATAQESSTTLVSRSHEHV